MNIEQQINETKAKQQEIVNRINLLADEMNRLNQQRQELLQEALRLDGEMRLLNRMSESS